MTAVRKFMFEHDFDAEGTHDPERSSTSAPSGAEAEPEDGPEAEAPETPPAVYTEADLEAARAESYQHGYDAGVQAGQTQGREAAETEASQAAQTALKQVAMGLNQLFQGLDEAETRRERRALELAMTIARRLFPALERRYGLAEVQAVVTRTLERLRDAPRAIVRAHPDTIATLENQRETLATETGYEGKLTLVSDTSMAPSDVSVAWADGSAKRDTAKVWAEIDAAIRSALDGAEETEIAAAQGRAEPDAGGAAPEQSASGGGAAGDASTAQGTGPAESGAEDAAATRTDDGAAPAAAGSSA